MKFKVYHGKDWALNSDLHFVDSVEINPHWEGGYKPIASNYRMVAEVETDALGMVFQLTNHIDKEWQENEGVKAYTDKARSTSVGDLIEDENGKLWMVAGIGFEEVEWYMGMFKHHVSRGGSYLVPLSHDDINRVMLYQSLVNDAAEMDEIDDFTKEMLSAGKRGLKKMGIEV